MFLKHFCQHFVRLLFEEHMLQGQNSLDCSSFEMTHGK